MLLGNILEKHGIAHAELEKELKDWEKKLK
jgi:hypothetical protein